MPEGNFQGFYFIGRRKESHEFKVGMMLVLLQVKSTMEENVMLGWAVTFLIIGLIAAVFGFTGIAGAATNIAWILFVVGIVLAVVFMISGRKPRV